MNVDANVRCEARQWCLLNRGEAFRLGRHEKREAQGGTRQSRLRTSCSTSSVPTRVARSCSVVPSQPNPTTQRGHLQSYETKRASGNSNRSNVVSREGTVLTDRALPLFLMPDSADRPFGHSSGALPADSVASDVITLFDELRLPLRRYLTCLGMTPQDADDGVQETFLRLHRHIETDGDRTNLRGWLFEVARNLANDRHRGAWVRRMRTKSPGGELTTIPASGDNPEEELLKAERVAWIRNADRRLTPQQAECFRLRAAGLRYREIAAVMGIGISAVGELVQRATLRLKKDFDGNA